MADICRQKVVVDGREIRQLTKPLSLAQKLKVISNGYLKAEKAIDEAKNKGLEPKIGVGLDKVYDDFINLFDQFIQAYNELNEFDEKFNLNYQLSFV